MQDCIFILFLFNFIWVNVPGGAFVKLIFVTYVEKAHFRLT